MKQRELTSEIQVGRPLDQVFEFFSDASNLDAITPSWLEFRILTPTPIRMGVGTIIDYALKVRGVPIKWRSEITVWQPPHRFVDEQRRGPYRTWIHEHHFEAVDGGTMIKDIVRYSVRGGVFEPWLHKFLVGPDLEKIFRHRASRMKEIMGVAGPSVQGCDNKMESAAC